MSDGIGCGHRGPSECAMRHSPARHGGSDEGRDCSNGHRNRSSRGDTSEDRHHRHATSENATFFYSGICEYPCTAFLPPLAQENSLCPGDRAKYTIHGIKGEIADSRKLIVKCASRSHLINHTRQKFYPSRQLSSKRWRKPATKKREPLEASGRRLTQCTSRK